MKKTLLLLFINFYNILSAQNPGNIDIGYYSNLGFNNNVHSIAVQPDGKILVGGSFTTFNGGAQNRLIRLNSDGTKDSSFNIGGGFDNTIYSIALQSDGKILVGGAFDRFTPPLVSTITQNGLMRLNADGSKDTTFNIGQGFNGVTSTVKYISLQPDGKILVGGSINLFNTSNIYNLIRLNSDGTKDTSFNIGTGFDNSVEAIAIQPDGKILVGGAFTNFKGNFQNRLIRLNTDGSKDTSFNISQGAGGIVYAIALQADNKILVGGIFTGYYTGLANTQNRLVRINTDGTKDTSFNIGTGFDNGVTSIALQSDGKILVGGNFTTFNGATQQKLIRLNTDGSKDNNFNLGTGFQSTINSIALQQDKKFWAGGNFTTFQGQPFEYLVRFIGDSYLSTNDFSKINITLYPNPTKDILNFTLSESISATAYEIYNLLGEKVSYGDLNTNSISVSNLANGVYIVKIRTNEGVLISKFIKE